MIREYFNVYVYATLQDSREGECTGSTQFGTYEDALRLAHQHGGYCASISWPLHSTNQLVYYYEVDKWWRCDL